MWDLEKYADNNAIIDDSGICITYKDLLDESKKFYELVEPRSLVVILCTNSPASIIGYVSFVNNQVVPLLLNADLDEMLLQNIIEKYKPTYVWIPRKKSELFDGYNVKYELFDYLLIETKCNTSIKMNPQLCLLLTTSGSTGSPKFVKQSYENVKTNALAIAEYLCLNAAERPITTLPMNYTYGLSIINSHLMVGATLLTTEKGFFHKDFWPFFRKQQATSFGGVPYTYEMLDRLRFYRMQLPSLRYFTQAGGKLSTNLQEKFAAYAQEQGKEFIVMYGQCEATARISYLPNEKCREKCGSIGVAIPGGKLYLIDDNNNIISQSNTVGELVYEGPNVTLGYAESREDLEKGDERGGILYTGDLAVSDEEGYYYIVGRKKRFLKIFGNRVNLDEIDQMIKLQYDAIDCASAGTDDHMYIFVTKHIEDDVKKFIASKTKLNSSAFHILYVDSIPKNEAGKTLYKELEKYYKDVN